MDDPQKKAIVLANIDKMVKGGASEAEIEAYIQSEGITPVDPNAALHAAYKSGNLQRRYALENKVEGQQDAEDIAARERELRGSLGERIASNYPGGRTAMTGLRYLTKKAIGEPETWAESAAANAQGVEEGGQLTPGVDIPVLGRVSVADLPGMGATWRLAGKVAPKLGAAAARTLTKTAAPTLARLATKFGSSVAGQGATFSGGQRALAPENPTDITGRVLGTLGHAAIGATVPVAIETGLRVPSIFGAAVESKFAPRVDANVNARLAARDAAADPAFRKFEALGELPLTDESGAPNSLSSVMSNPVIRKAIASAKQDINLQDLPDNHAAVLKEARSNVSNRAWLKDNGFQAGGTARAFTDAIESAANQVGGSIKAATVPFGEASQQARDVYTGRNVLRNQISGNTPVNKVRTESPAAFTDKMAGDVPVANREAAAEGILGELGRQGLVDWGWNTKLIPRRTAAWKAAPDLLAAARGKTTPSISALVDALTPDFRPRYEGTQPPLGDVQGQARGVLRDPTPGRPMPSGAPKLLPSTTTPVIDELTRPKALLTAGSGEELGPIGERGAFPGGGENGPLGMSHGTPPTLVPVGPPQGPAIPTLGPAEKLARAVRMAQEQSAARGEPFSMEDFIKRRDQMESTDGALQRRLTEALKAIANFQSP